MDERRPFSVLNQHQWQMEQFKEHQSLDKLKKTVQFLGSNTDQLEIELLRDSANNTIQGNHEQDLEKALDGIRDSLKSYQDIAQLDKTAEQCVHDILRPKPQSSIQFLIDEALFALRNPKNPSTVPDEKHFTRKFETVESLKYARVMPNSLALIYNKDGAVDNPDALHPLHYQFHIPESTDILKKIEEERATELARERIQLQNAIQELTKPWRPPHQRSYPMSRFSDLQSSETKDIDAYLYQEEAIEREIAETRAKKRELYHKEIDELDEYSTAKTLHRQNKGLPDPVNADKKDPEPQNNSTETAATSDLEFQTVLTTLLARNIWGVYSEDQRYLVFQRILKESPKMAWKLGDCKLDQLGKLNLSKKITTYDDSYIFSLDESIVLIASFLKHFPKGIISRDIFKKFSSSSTTSSSYSSCSNIKITNETIKTQLPIKNCEIWNQLIKFAKDLSLSTNDFCQVFGQVLVGAETTGILNMEKDNVILESALISILNRMPEDILIVRNILNSHAGTYLIRASLPIMDDGMERNQQKSLVESLIHVIDDNWIAQSVSAIINIHLMSRDSWKSLFDVGSIAGISFQYAFFKLSTYQQKLARTLVKSIEKASSDYYEIDPKKFVKKPNRNDLRLRILNVVYLIDLLFQSMSHNTSQVPQPMLAILKETHEMVKRKFSDARDLNIPEKVLNMLWFGNGLAAIMKEVKEVSNQKVQNVVHNIIYVIQHIAFNRPMKGEFKPFEAFRKTFSKKMDDHVLTLLARFNDNFGNEMEARVKVSASANNLESLHLSNLQLTSKESLALSQDSKLMDWLVFIRLNTPKLIQNIKAMEKFAKIKSPQNQDQIKFIRSIIQSVVSP